jgi:hypothetical protein
VYRPHASAQAKMDPPRNATTPVAPVYRPTAPARTVISGSLSPAPVAQRKTFGQYVWALNKKGILSPKVKERLREGQEAIQKTRKKLGAGAGNITQQVDRSSGISYVTTHFVKQVANEYTKQGVNPLEAWAIAARRGSAGNCDEFAAVTYFYLLEMNINDNVSVVALPDVHHHFVMIGDVADPANDDAVVVDPWPAKGFAVRYQEWEYKGETMETTLGPTLSTGQTPLKAARAKLNLAGHTKKAVDKGLTEAFQQYATSENLKKQIEVEKAKPVGGGRYLWGNVNTVKKENLEKLENAFIKHADFEQVLMSDEELAASLLA